MKLGLRVFPKFLHQYPTSGLIAFAVSKGSRKWGRIDNKHARGPIITWALPRGFISYSLLAILSRWKA